MRARRSLAAIVISTLLTAARIAAAADGQLELRVVDKDTGRPIACRIHLQTAAGRPVKIPGTVAWGDHFVFFDKVLLKLPVGNYTFVVERGLEYHEMTGHFRIDHFADDSKTIELHRFCNLAKEGWWSGDLDLQRPDKDLQLLMQAEDLHVAPLVTFTNTKTEWTARAVPANPLVQFDVDRYYQLLGGEDTRRGGVLAYLNLEEPLDLKPPLDHVAEARQQAGSWVDLRATSAWDLPVWIASNRIDSVEVLNRQFGRDAMYADGAGEKPRDKQNYPPPLGIGRWSQQVYFNLLDCGLRIPPTAGSGSGVCPNPAGYNRVYAYCGEQFSYQKWWDALRAGQVVITDGPLLRPDVEGHPPGFVFQAAAGEKLELEIGLTLSTRDKIRYLEIIQNGRVIHEVRLDDWAKAGGKLPKLQFDSSGWFLVRAVAESQKIYRCAMTAPYYVQIGDQPRISRRAVQFFLDWLKQREAQFKDDGATLHPTSEFWQTLLTKANAE